MPHAVFVDVSPASRATIARALESLGIEHGEATSVADAGAQLLQRRAVLLFAPSFESARDALTVSSDGAATAVVVCSDDRASAAKALRAGADAVVDAADPIDLVAVTIERALERTRGRVAAAAGAEGDAPKPLEEVARAAAEEAERRHISTVLTSVRGNRTRAASLLGVARSTLWHKLRRYGLESASGGSDAPPIDEQPLAR